MKADIPSETHFWMAPCVQDLAASMGSGAQPPAPRAGERCPRCGQARLDFDGLLNLSCPACGYGLNGSFT